MIQITITLGDGKEIFVETDYADLEVLAWRENHKGLAKSKRIRAFMADTDGLDPHPVIYEDEEY